MPSDILQRLTSVKEGVGLCWLGNLSWLLYANNQLIAFDLDLESNMRISGSPIPTYEIADLLDVHFITHEHGDHFNPETSQILAHASSCLFVLPANCVQKADELGIPKARIHIAHPDKPFDLHGIHASPQRALHGHLNTSVYRGANLEDCGYVLEFGGKRFMQPGDTVLLHEHLELKDIDVLFVSPTEHNTLIYPSAAMINAINPGCIFPQHFGTYTQDEQNYFWTRGYPDELKAVLPEALQNRFHKLEQGEIYVI